MFFRISSASVMTSNPLIDAEPELGRSSVAKIRTSVVFPAPFLPMSPKMPEFGTEKLTESKAFRDSSLYVLLRFSQMMPLMLNTGM